MSESEEFELFKQKKAQNNYKRASAKERKSGKIFWEIPIEKKVDESAIKFAEIAGLSM